MYMNVTCPLCGHPCRVPERSLGQQARCPNCSGHFHCGSLSPPSLATRPVSPESPAPAQATPPARAASAEPGQEIHYRCPRCSESLTSPGHMAGQKVHCLACDQRLQIPVRDRPVVVRAVASPPAPVVPSLAAVPASPTTRRDGCLECGRELAARTLTCPDCGSLFCAAACFRSHRYHAHPSRG